MIGTLHLTTSNPELEEKTRVTVPGMAHWAEPTSNKRCGECEFWRDELNRKTARRCEKFSQLMHGIRGSRIPRDTKACKYFAEVEG
jgi:hypothetical protein